MKLLFILDNNDYQGRENIFKREAVRTFIKHNDKLLMIKSSLYGECKFIGGGVENGESHIDALKREAKEEGGLILKESFIPLGYVIEKRASVYDENEIFYMKSYYYLCEVKEFEESNLQDYEIEYDYKLIIIDAISAIENNERIEFNINIPWKERDTTFLKLILDNKIKI